MRAVRSKVQRRTRQFLGSVTAWCQENRNVVRVALHVVRHTVQRRFGRARDASVQRCSSSSHCARQRGVIQEWLVRDGESVPPFGGCVRLCVACGGSEPENDYDLLWRQSLLAPVLPAGSVMLAAESERLCVPAPSTSISASLCRVAFAECSSGSSGWRSTGARAQSSSMATLSMNRD